MTLNQIMYAFIAFFLLGMLLIGIARHKEGRNSVVNFRSMFIIGALWMPIGIVLSNPSLGITGLIFFLIGIVNKKKWERERTWSELSPTERRVKVALLVGLSFLMFGGLAVYWSTR